MAYCPECDTQLLDTKGLTVCPYCDYSSCNCELCTMQDVLSEEPLQVELTYTFTKEELERKGVKT